VQAAEEAEEARRHDLELEAAAGRIRARQLERQVDLLEEELARQAELTEEARGGEADARRALWDLNAMLEQGGHAKLAPRARARFSPPAEHLPPSPVADVPENYLTETGIPQRPPGAEAPWYLDLRHLPDLQKILQLQPELQPELAKLVINLQTHAEFRRLEDARGLRRAEQFLAAGRHDEAMAAFEDVLQRLDARDVAGEFPRAQAGYGNALAAVSRWAEAAGLYRSALAAYGRLNNSHESAMVASNLAESLYRLGGPNDLAEAHALLTWAAQHWYRTGDSLREGIALMTLARVALALHAESQAGELARRAVALLAQAGRPDLAAAAIQVLERLAAKGG